MIAIGKNYRYRIKESIYGDAIILLKDSFAYAHLYRKTAGHQDEEFMRAMIKFCENLKKIFDKKTRSKCSVSIKVPIKTNIVVEGTSLENLCRDPENHRTRDTVVYSKTNHTIIGNTAFQKSLNNVLKNNSKKYYINNSISKLGDNYDNTSRDCYADGKLPYDSELVYPIVPIFNLDEQNIECCGFLCIDCVHPNSFDEYYDVAIIQGVADGIYDLISQRNITKNH